MSEKKTKPKYSSVENVGWMIANAWRECKSVLLICFTMKPKKAGGADNVPPL
ncbi:TPA: hypothetical protein U1Z60_002059 [Streptococcus suis]|nr:hypothetical protein [Streptococcus suis]HEM4562517.1 hypothetical protein [Streptococcus suis]